MKKLFADLLIIAFLTGMFCPCAPAALPPVPGNSSQPAFEGILKQSEIKIDSIDPLSDPSFTGRFFPGGRGSNQLIIYTKDSGLRTGTNEFGAEAVVVDNTVVQISGADSIIPSNGFIISGHGRAKNWINENLLIGTKVYVDSQNKKLTAYLTNDSFLFATREKIKEVGQIINYYKGKDTLYNDYFSKYYIDKAQENLQQAAKKPDDTQKYSSQAINCANKALQHAIPYYESEFKGVWLRPVEKTPEDIKNTLDRVKSFGIENIFLETYFQGKTIFPSETLARYNVQQQRNEFVGFDPLKIWIEEAHKRNMKIHIWFQTFYAGNENPNKNPLNVVHVYPQWANVTKAKYNSSIPVSSLSEHNGYFLDPANPAVHTYLLALLKEIIERYNPDGINLDYIRYPQSISAKFAGYELSNWGYTQYARNEFKNRYGVDPVELVYGTEEWTYWDKYRQDKVTDFVYKAKLITYKKGIPLTAVIFPDRLKSMEVKMQDWKTWSVYNYVDGFTPLILTCDKDTADYLIRDIRVNSQPQTKIYPGLFVPFMNGNPDDLLRQIHQSRKLKASGVIMFDYAHMQPKYTDVLLVSAFTKPEKMKLRGIPLSEKRKAKKIIKEKNKQNDSDKTKKKN